MSKKKTTQPAAVKAPAVKPEELFEEPTTTTEEVEIELEYTPEGVPCWRNEDGDRVLGLKKKDFLENAKPEAKKLALSEFYKYMAEIHQDVIEQLEKRIKGAKEHKDVCLSKSTSILKEPTQADKDQARLDAAVKQGKAMAEKLGITHEQFIKMLTAKE